MGAHARWPGWTKQRTLLLSPPPGEWPPPRAPVVVDGLVLEPKRELHVTIVGRALGAELARATEAGRVPAAAVRDAFLARDWTWTRPGRWSLLRAPAQGRQPERHSVVEHLALPAMAGFHAALGDLLGRPLPVPPPHVTLYVAGGQRGIGLPDEATLQRRRLRTFTPDTRPREDAGRPS